MVQIHWGLLVSGDDPLSCNGDFPPVIKCVGCHKEKLEKSMEQGVILLAAEFLGKYKELQGSCNVAYGLFPVPQFLDGKKADAADKRLQQAKENGWNQVRVQLFGFKSIKLYLILKGALVCIIVKGDGKQGNVLVFARIVAIHRNFHYQWL